MERATGKFGFADFVVSRQVTSPTEYALTEDVYLCSCPVLADCGAHFALTGQHRFSDMPYTLPAMGGA
jgi:hypothetical protein